MSKKQKLTPWFPADVKPVRDGVYKTAHGYQFWSGKFWGGWSSTKEIAYCNRFMWSSAQQDKWCGLASDPKEAA